METSRLQQLAGLPITESLTTFKQLNEVVELSDDLSIDELVKRLDACSRALKIANGLPAEDGSRKKWISAVFVNLNKVRAAVQRHLADQNVPQADRKTAIDGVRTRAAAPVQGAPAQPAA